MQIVSIRYHATSDQFTLGDEVLANQWVNYLGGRYFTTPSGTVYRDTFLTFGKCGMYYVGPTGLMLVGKHEIHGDLYYFAEEGLERGRLVQSNQWTETADGRVFPRSDGRLYRNQFISFGSTRRYYVDNIGVMATGPVPVNGTVMDFDEYGLLIQRQHQYVYNDQMYFSDDQGTPYRNAFVTHDGDTYYVGADGAAVRGVFALDGTAYRMGQDGRLVRSASAYEYQGKKYYARPDGWPYRRCVLELGPNQSIYLGDDGAQCFGLIDAGDATYYADPQTGSLIKKAGLLTVKGATYHSGDTYALTRGWKEIDGQRYYFDPEAEWPQRVEDEDRVIDDEAYHFDSHGVASIREPVYVQQGEWSYNGYTLSGPEVRDRAAGEDLVVISLDHQYMWVFSDGELAYETAVITGKPGSRTIRGNFRVEGKQRDRYLKGPDWKSWVSYWIQFSGDYGIHDASWQSGRNFYYNSDANTWAGSHGCVNIYPSDMPTIYRLVHVGTPVTVY